MSATTTSCSPRVAAALATGLSAIANLATFGLMFGNHDDDDDSGAGPFATLVLLLVAPVAATLLQLALSRSREFEADHAGAELLGGDGRPLAQALQRIDLSEANLRLRDRDEPLGVSGRRVLSAYDRLLLTATSSPATTRRPS